MDVLAQRIAALQVAEAQRATEEMLYLRCAMDGYPFRDLKPRCLGGLAEPMDMILTLDEQITPWLLSVCIGLCMQVMQERHRCRCGILF